MTNQPGAVGKTNKRKAKTQNMHSKDTLSAQGINLPKISKQAQDFLLKLSRKALEHYFKTGMPLHLTPSDLPERIAHELLEPRATFVTLKKIERADTAKIRAKNTTEAPTTDANVKKQTKLASENQPHLHQRFSLRGCIGTVVPVAPLYLSVIKNTYSAAFEDPRFPPLSEQELPEIRIEISVLTPQQRLEYQDFDTLRRFLNKHRPGVTIKYGPYGATFLPTVWEQLPNVEEFLAHLCLKAGLMPNCVQTLKPEIYIYFAQVFEEE